MTTDPIADLVASLEAQPPRTPAEAARRLRHADLRVDDLRPWFDFDHPARDGYGRRLVFQGENFELMVMSWLPGDYSAIHDHGSTQWGAVRYFGEADHATFVQRGDVLSVDRRWRVAPGTVLRVDHDLIHLMGNPNGQPFVSMHLYGTPEPNASITGDARIFDLYTGRIERTDGGVFFCLPDAEVVRREPGPRGDAPTRRFHHQLMRDRALRILEAGDTSRDWPTLVAELDRELAALEVDRAG